MRFKLTTKLPASVFVDLFFNINNGICWSNEFDNTIMIDNHCKMKSASSNRQVTFVATKDYWASVDVTYFTEVEFDSESGVLFLAPNKDLLMVYLDKDGAPSIEARMREMGYIN